MAGERRDAYPPNLTSFTLQGQAHSLVDSSSTGEDTMGGKSEEPLATEMGTAAEPWTRQTWTAADIFIFVDATELDQLSELWVVTVDLGVIKHWVCPARNSWDGVGKS